MSENVLQQIETKGCTMGLYDVIISGPNHLVLALKGLDRIHTFTNKNEEKCEMNILGIEWSEATIAKIYAFWKDAKTGKDQGGVFYYFTQSEQGVVVSLDPLV